MNDRICLSGLRVRGHHGVYDFEREQGQDFVVDVVLELDLAPAAASDDVTDTVHYGELADALVAIVGGEPVNLLETLADRLVDACLAQDRVARATVTVHKPQAPIPHQFLDVSVTLTPGPAAMTRAVLSLGSNLGDRYGHLCAAVAGLGSALRAVSGVYETPPWGDLDQPSYLNAVVLVEDEVEDTEDDHDDGSGGAHRWLAVARDLERAAARERDPGRRFGPRTLDVDVIAAWRADGTDVVSDDPDLTLPHPRAAERAFVLRPWLDVQPAARLPGHGPVAELLRTGPAAADLPGVVARPDLVLPSGPVP